ncbi:hypothetical protein OOK43_24020 [[Kitasatospora] papulosa]|uniref:hypothetical protein n=1 Tax=Streptomyces TaxID=1883 RepID=UPI0004C8E608|nr:MULTISPECIES: hypothetical protein [Streptomyces]MCX4416326.1 hypothetical protein [[Kitasatospora] papulosa]WSZ52120.1 hypothetical protein OG337_34220 [[Kitasatospora] papulosa]
MNARRRTRAKARNLLLARRLRSHRRNRPPPPLPVRRPGSPGTLPRPPDGLDAHRPDIGLLRRVYTRLIDSPEP